MGVLEEIFSTFGIKTSDLEESKPTPPKETAPTTDQVNEAIHNYRSNLKGCLKDNTTYPNSSEELQAFLIARNIIPNSSIEVAPNQVTPTTEEVIMDTSEEFQNEPSPTEEPYQIPPKRLTCRDQTQDPNTQGPEIKNQFSPLIQMDAENSTAMPERKKQMPPFFITPNASWPETCKRAPDLYQQGGHSSCLRPRKVQKILNIAQLTSGRTKQPIPLFLIKIANSLVADEILKISSLHGIRVTVEKYRGRNIVPQCQRCYGFYHSSENCFLKKVHCGVCAGDHPTKNANSNRMQKENASTAREATQPSTEDAQISPRRNPPHQKWIYPTPPHKNQEPRFTLKKIQ
ncbi:hypothetical protein CEXT_385061 [Caerostris extrusa]|uniref:Pre-C2HC domain-containing protein n=1 Tax=Caerostris extrusa TaxID=172846 RepID=A0AAV4QKQ2_CAEEX|nr:hypothetical protein CEXT_385061 [Caerostris extrusa]